MDEIKYVPQKISIFYNTIYLASLISPFPAKLSHLNFHPPNPFATKHNSGRS